MVRALSCFLITLLAAQAVIAADDTPGDDIFCLIDGVVLAAGSDPENACENAEFMCVFDVANLAEENQNDESCNITYGTNCEAPPVYFEAPKCNLWRVEVGIAAVVDPHFAQAHLNAKQECYDIYADAGQSTCTQLLNCSFNDLSYECLEPCYDKTWFKDSDGDGYGGASTAGDTCNPPAGGPWVGQGGDCDDTNPNVNPGVDVTVYPDADGDGYGAAGGAQTVSSCAIPGGTVSNGDDCDDSNAQYNPTASWYADADGDGFGAGAATAGCPPSPSHVANDDDCNDGDAEQHPGQFWYTDADGDGEGAGAANMQCAPPASWFVSNADDCDDADFDINSQTAWYPDADGDGYGDEAGAAIVQCVGPQGHAPQGGDCDDGDASLNPDTAWYHDDDQDGLGGELLTHACAPINGYFWAPCTVEGGPYAMDCQENANGIGFSCDLEPMFTAFLPNCPFDPAFVVRDPGDLDDSDPTIGLAQPMDADGDGRFADRRGFFLPVPFFLYIRGEAVFSAPDCDDRDPAAGCRGYAYRDLDRDGLGDPRHVISTDGAVPPGFARFGTDFDDRVADDRPVDSLLRRPGALFQHGGELCTVDAERRMACLPRAFRGLCGAARRLTELHDARDLDRVDGDPVLAGQMLLACLIEANAQAALAVRIVSPGQPALLGVRNNLVTRMDAARCVAARDGEAVTRDGDRLATVRVDARAYDTVAALLAEDRGQSCAIPRRAGRDDRDGEEARGGR